MTAQSVPIASLYFIASVSISLAALAVLAGVSPLSAIVRAATAFLFFSLLGWVALFTMRAPIQGGMEQPPDEAQLGTRVDISVGPDEDELELDVQAEQTEA